MNKIQSSTKLDDFKVIRKLGIGECLYDNELLNNNMYQTRAFITSINKKYAINMDVLNKALTVWIQIHPLLQATTFRELDPSTQKARLGLPRYFVYMNKSIDEYNNVEIQQETTEFKWTDLIESELKTSLDYVNGPLWRLKVLKMLECDDISNKYAFILTTSHSISDGRNGYSIGVQFLDILIDALENNLSPEIVQIPSNYSCDELIQEYVLRPTFKITDKNPDFDRETHRLPNNVGNKSGVHGRFDFIFLESAKLEKLIKKMKSKAPKAKVTSLLLILLCDSYKRICVDYQVDNIPLERVQVAVLASLRDKLAIKNTQMGVYSAPLFSGVKFETKVEKERSAIAIPDVFLKAILFAPKYVISYLFQNVVLNNSFLRKGFFSIFSTMLKMKPRKKYQNNYSNLSESQIWSLAESETICMHTSIANNAELTFKADNFFLELINSNFDFANNSAGNFCLSNIGIMNNTKNGEIIKLNEHYVAVPCLENRFGAVLQFGITTIDNNLNIAICFNEKIFSLQFINDLKNDLLQKIKNISQ